MKKITVFTIFLLSVSLIADFDEIKNKAKITFADQKPLTIKDCNKIMNSMIEMVKKENPEKTEEIERNREIIFHLYMIECESGKFDLNCLANIKLLSELDNCKRKQ